VSMIDLNDRWRKLLPIFANRQLLLRANGDEIKNIDVVPSNQDPQEISDAITIIRVAQEGVSATGITQLLKVLERRELHGQMVYSALKKVANGEELMTILLEMAKREMLQARFGKWQGYIDALQSELEAEPTPLTRASELARLGLPSL
jgi:hypothetical protein